LSTVADAIGRECAVFEHEATVVNGARRVEEHNAAPGAVTAEMREPRRCRAWAEAPHELPGAAAREVRRPIPGLDACAERQRAGALPALLVIAAEAAAAQQGGQEDDACRFEDPS
jgi:hypothetical protein